MNTTMIGLNLEQIPDIGPTTTNALVVSLVNAKNFDGRRQVAVWLGLGPYRHSRGGKQNLLAISKRNDTNLRTLLIHGAFPAMGSDSVRPGRGSSRQSC